MSAIDLTHTSDEEDGEARREAPPPAKRRRTGGGASSESAAATVDLTDDEPLVAATGAKKADDKPPPWLVQQGVRRIMAEFRALTEALEARPGSLGALRRLWLPDDDNLLVWRMECSGFDEDLQGGRDINADLASLSRQTGGRASSIVMEATFPKAYPTQPFFLRVVTPRMVMYTGHGLPLALSLPPHVRRPSVGRLSLTRSHSFSLALAVTAGGSICVEALTSTGTPNAWQRTYTFENIFLMVLHNMIDVEPMVVRTATGPGGRSGPLRVDLRQGVRYCTSE